MITLHLKVASSLRDTLCESVRESTAASSLDESTAAEIMQSGRLSLQMEEGSTPSDLLNKLGLPTEQRLMIIVDGKMVARTEYGTRELTDGVTVSLNPPIQAG